MKNLKTQLLLGSVFFTIILSSCNKGTALDSSQTAPPSVSIYAPSNEQQFNEGDTVWINASINSEEALHDFSLQIFNITENREVYLYNGHSHGQSNNLNIQFIPAVNMDAVMQITITTLDHNGNLNKRKSIFKVKNVNLLPVPIIQITSPNLSSYSKGSLLRLTGAVSHTLGLKNVQITLLSNGMEVLKYTDYLMNQKTYSFDTSYQLNAAANSEFIFIVLATDTMNTTTQKTFNFLVK